MRVHELICIRKEPGMKNYSITLLKNTGRLAGFLFKLSMAGIWTICMLAGGELGLAAIGAGIIYFGFTAILG